MTPRKFTIIIERDPSGGFVASVTQLPGCFTQAETLEALRENVKEAIALYLEDEEILEDLPEFIGVESVEVSA